MMARRSFLSTRATPLGVAGGGFLIAALSLAGSLFVTAPAAAQGPSTGGLTLGVPPAAPVSAPPPRRRLALGGGATSLSYNAAVETSATPRPALPGSRRQRAAAAFALSMREESLRFRDAQPWTNVPPQLEDDRLVREVRERAAERILGEAVANALESFVLRQPPEAESGFHVLVGTRTGFDLDGSPSWQVRRRGERSGLRLDVPLTPTALRLHAWHYVGSEKGIDRIGTTLSIDPWDDSARLSFRLEF